MAATKPANLPEWATDDVTLPVSGQTNKIRPEEAMRASGWDQEENPAAEEFNWQLNNIYENLVWVSDFLTNPATGEETLDGDYRITGNLVVEGQVQEDLKVKDTLITLNEGETGAGVTAGISGVEIDRGSLDNAEIVFDESDGEWKVSTDAGVTRKPILTEFNIARFNAGMINGLITSNNGTDADHDLDITSGVCVDSSNSEFIDLASALTKQIDANWVAGNNAGGFPSTLTLSADTWYAVFVIKHADGTVDAGFDTSITATNLLSDSGYSFYRRIGWVRTDASSNILGFEQTGPRFIWDAVSSEGSINDGAVQTVLAPRDTIGLFAASLNPANTGGTGYALFSSTNQQIVASSTAFHVEAGVDGGIEPSSGNSGIEVLVDSNNQIWSDVAGGGFAGSQLSTHGWIDTRGRD